MTAIAAYVVLVVLPALLLGHQTAPTPSGGLAVSRAHSGSQTA